MLWTIPHAFSISNNLPPELHQIIHSSVFPCMAKATHKNVNFIFADFIQYTCRMDIKNIFDLLVVPYMVSLKTTHYCDAHMCINFIECIYDDACTYQCW